MKAFVRIFFILPLCFLSFAPLSAAGSARETPIVRIIRNWAPSIVNISTERVVFLAQNPLWGNYGGQYDDFFGNYRRSALGTMKLQSLGSGVIVSEDGLIATNAHVVHMASKIYVTLQDGVTAEATVIGTNTKDDIALIQIIPPHELKPIRFAQDVWIGETVVTVGNPLGLQNSVSSGIVSGTGRSFYAPETNQAFGNLIQTDASINPGSSGGALLNLDGELIGINLAVVQEAHNIGFAVPVRKIQEMLEEYYRLRQENKVVVLS